MDLGNVNGNCYALVDLILHVCVCVCFLDMYFDTCDLDHHYFSRTK